MNAQPTPLEEFLALVTRAERLALELALPATYLTGLTHARAWATRQVAKKDALHVG